MGVCISSNSPHYHIDGNSSASKERSYAIDRQIEEDAKKYKRECKILLLGSGESGKSTIVKQMKIIHQNGYTREELLLFKLTIYKNIIDSAQAVVVAMRKLKLDPVEPINQSYSDKILDYVLDFNQHGGGLNPEIVRAIESLWHDPIIPAVLDRGSEFYLMDSAGYFFDQVTRIGLAEYIPNEVDVLMARTKTTGISETKFKSGQLSIHMFDVGGQRSERKKWIHCFEAVTSIIFCVALSEYDQVLLEESGQIDIFKAKLPKVPLERFFPEYTGGNDVNKAAKYILWRFTQLNRARLSIYPQYYRMLYGIAVFSNQI
ncbi:guanine nucleotide-binding protein alpha-3 subunit [Puccinia sorghi]|uniref:Guanine nucleotide-binding protein alpha-3 subunit n=1 Tax=Puccinia sorghi TaxID=27349 RepID=A0A0L6VQ51_9BASI|nr:guanine nucleotide-binding protein alpha-3 subunit [Puccinia sorghi]